MIPTYSLALFVIMLCAFLAFQEGLIKLSRKDSDIECGINEDKARIKRAAFLIYAGFYEFLLIVFISCTFWYQPQKTEISDFVELWAFFVIYTGGSYMRVTFREIYRLLETRREAIVFGIVLLIALVTFIVALY